MVFGAALVAVAQTERALLADAAFPDDLAELAIVALSGPDSVLGSAAEPRWARLPLLACASATCDNAFPAVPLAAALEIQVAAYSLLDDVMDGDVSDVIRRGGPAATLNAAAALLALGQRAFLDVPKPVALALANGWVGLCRG